MIEQKVIEVKGNVERFNGLIWEDVVYEVPIEITPIGELHTCTYALVTGDVPIRWISEDPSVRVMEEIGAAL